jgi:tetratricopeptide (TPR) repeat protein
VRARATILLASCVVVVAPAPPVTASPPVATSGSIAALDHGGAVVPVAASAPAGPGAELSPVGTATWVSLVDEVLVPDGPGMATARAAAMAEPTAPAASAASAPRLGSTRPTAAIASVVQATATQSRQEALADLGKPDAEARRQAATRLGEIGTMADAPALLRALHDPDEQVRFRAERAVWQVWSRAGDPEIDALFEQGLEQMNRGLADAAIATFSTIVTKKPEFAEGWNKRATIYFLIGDYDKSLADCAEVVKRNPQHFGVLSGYGQIYLRLDEPERALDYFERALKINPNLGQVEAVIGELRRIIVEKRRGTI